MVTNISHTSVWDNERERDREKSRVERSAAQAAKLWTIQEEIIK
jgi:hypothetical protein